MVSRRLATSFKYLRKFVFREAGQSSQIFGGLATDKACMTTLWSRTISEIPIGHGSFDLPDPLQETMVDIRDHGFVQNMFMMNSEYHFPANRVSKHFFGELCCLVDIARAKEPICLFAWPNQIDYCSFSRFEFKLVVFENPKQHACHCFLA